MQRFRFVRRRGIARPDVGVGSRDFLPWRVEGLGVWLRVKDSITFIVSPHSRQASRPVVSSESSRSLSSRISSGSRSTPSMHSIIAILARHMPLVRNQCGDGLPGDGETEPRKQIPCVCSSKCQPIPLDTQLIKQGALVLVQSGQIGGMSGFHYREDGSAI